MTSTIADVPADVNESPVEPTVETPVLDEITEEEYPKFIGQCKWFSDKLGYGFITICDGDKKGSDIFAHHSGIKPLNSNYKTLRKGEYVEFNIIDGVNGKQAINITGINKGALMCDFVTPKKVPTDTQYPAKYPVVPRGKPVASFGTPTDEWQQYRPKKKSYPPGGNGASGSTAGAGYGKKPFTKYNKLKPQV